MLRFQTRIVYDGRTIEKSRQRKESGRHIFRVQGIRKGYGACFRNRTYMAGTGGTYRRKEGGGNMDAILWLAAVVVLLVIEIATLGLTTIWFAGGALIAGIAAVAGAGSSRAVCDVSDCLTDPADFYKTGGRAIPECQSNPYQCGKPDWQGGGGDTDD